MSWFRRTPDEQVQHLQAELRHARDQLAHCKAANVDLRVVLRTANRAKDDARARLEAAEQAGVEHGDRIARAVGLLDHMLTLRELTADRIGEVRAMLLGGEVVGTDG